MNQPLLFGTINFQKLLTVAEVARVFEFLKKTGEMMLAEYPTAKINFIDGKIVHAKFNQQEGNEAAVKILQLSDCNVSFTLGPKTQQSSVTLQLSKLLEEAAQTAITAQQEQTPSDKTVPVKMTPEAQMASPAHSATAPQQSQSAAGATIQTSPSHPVPDTLKPSHGNPPTTPAVTLQTPQATSSAPGAPSGTAPQQKQTTPPHAGTAKKPVLRITLKGVSKDFPIIPGKLMTIGRTPDNDICIPDGQISTRHASLVLDAKGMHLVDQNSLNGVYFGGKKVTEIWLKPNDQFTLAEIPVIVTLA